MQKFDETMERIVELYRNDMKIFLDKSEMKQIIIFGAGELGHRMYDILKEWKIEVRCFCDNKMSGKKDKRTGLEIVSLNEIKDGINNLFVLIAVFDDSGYAEVYQQLLDFGFDATELMNSKIITERLTISYLKANLEKYKKAYFLLEDDFSKDVYLKRIEKAYLDNDISQIVSNVQEEYFDAAVVLADDEVFIDCGGFDGDTALKFIDKVNGRFKKVIIFEPENSKEALIKKRMRNYNYDFYPYGVWSCNIKLKFDARDDVASHISEEGDVEIEVRALDDTIFEDAPTYIKMDIEGSEIEALKGAKRIIQQYKPKLAICIYHNPEDLFEIPIMIKEMCRDYKILIRQYANSRFETVCYAV